MYLHVYTHVYIHICIFCNTRQHTPTRCNNMQRTILQHTYTLTYTHSAAAHIHTNVNKQCHSTHTHSRKHFVQCNGTRTHSQHTATHCNTLQHAATPCLGTQKHPCMLPLIYTLATCCNMLQHVATQCNTLQHSCRGTHTHTHTHTYTPLYAAAHIRTRNTYCNTVQHGATRCNTVQHGATRCNTLPQQTYTPMYVAPHMHTCNTLAPRNTLQHATTPCCSTHTPPCMHIYQQTVEIVDSVRDTEFAQHLYIYICIYIHICTYKCIYIYIHIYR